MHTRSICFKRILRSRTDRFNFHFIPLGAIPFILLLLMPTTVVFGATNPWGLFQQLCPTGRLATGPQCQGLSQGQQPFSTANPNTAAGTCPTGSILQNGVCVPFTNTNTCPTGSILQNGVCVPSTTPVQTAPIANAGASQTVTQGSTVSLDGTGSFSPNGANIVSYSWVQTSGTPVSLTGASTATPTFTAPTAVTSLVFSLTVTDSNGAVSTPATVTVTVS